MALTDSEGYTLWRYSANKILRHKKVWAVYRVEPGKAQIEERCSEFVVWDQAKAIADELNTQRGRGDPHFFSVPRKPRPVGKRANEEARNLA